MRKTDSSTSRNTIEDPFISHLIPKFPQILFPEF